MWPMLLLNVFLGFRLHTIVVQRLFAKGVYSFLRLTAVKLLYDSGIFSFVNSCPKRTRILVVPGHKDPSESIEYASSLPCSELMSRIAGVVIEGQL